MSTASTPNVLLVVMDTARADAFEPYGARAGATPAVASLAAAGRAVPRVHATANWTLPSHASLFSGRLPRELGIGSGPTLDAVLSHHQRRLLAPVLHRAGFHTIGVSANPFITPMHGFGQGFDRFFEVRSARRPPRPGPKGAVVDLADAALRRVDDGLDAADTALRGAIAEAPADQPWFAFVNLMECHAPYLPPDPWNDLGPLDRARAVDDARRWQSHAAVVEAALGRLDVPAAALDRMRHLYGRAIAMMDAWLGRLLDEVDGLADDTLVVVTSDHGENFGEGGLLGHALSVDERLLRIPLVVGGAGLDRVVLDDVNSIADVPRLVAEAVGLHRHPWGVPACPDGVAIAQNDGYSAINPAFADVFRREWQLDDEGARRLDEPLVAVVGPRHKVVRRGAGADRTDVVFDLDADPLEAAPTAPDPATLAPLLDALERAEHRGGVSAAGPTGSAATPVDDDVVDRLRLLGYL